MIKASNNLKNIKIIEFLMSKKRKKNNHKKKYKMKKSKKVLCKMKVKSIIKI